MHPELDNVRKQLNKAKCPEDVFGKLTTANPLKAGKFLYHQFAKVCHADRYTDPKDKKVADGAFQLLKKWWDQAEAKIEAKTYGDRKVAAATTVPEAVTIHSKKRVYVIGEPLSVTGDLADVLKAQYSEGGKTHEAYVKVVRNPKNNDLMAAERTSLEKLAKDKDMEFRIPQLLESITVADVTNKKRAANVFVPTDGLSSMNHILDAYKMAPLDPRDVAWMGSRTWTTLGLVHASGIVHGAFTPDHALICAENHGLVLVDWCYSVPIGEPIKAVSKKWIALYPPEVLKSLGATPAVDIYMAAFTLSILLGAATNVPHNPVFPAGVPIEMQRFLRSCLIPAPHRRPSDALELAADWKKMLEKNFGKPKFRIFNVPALAGA